MIIKFMNIKYGYRYADISFNNINKGILGTVKFNFIGDEAESNIKLTAEKTN